MGLIDTIKRFFAKRESAKQADLAIAGVKAAAESQNYNQASMKAFYALETIADAFNNMKREQHITAREFASKIAENDLLTDDELEPIVLNFEIAKYSESTVSFDDYSKAEASLTTVAEKFKSGQVRKAGKKKSKRRRRPRRGGRTGAAKKRPTKTGRKKAEKSESESEDES